MTEAAANHKIKRLLISVSNLINNWIPLDKRTQYINFLNENIIIEKENDE
tara:strand:+ start:257 stop:406 length:150 start_codon:yes stop_codon:yes gene_type:complete